jgi:hypothetical protein
VLGDQYRHRAAEHADPVVPPHIHADPPGAEMSYGDPATNKTRPARKASASTARWYGLGRGL